MSRKPIHPMDKHVGQQIRISRLNVGMSQEALGDALSLTFQQIQKYEKGTNRVSASRLQQIANVFKVPVETFFKGGPGHGNSSEKKYDSSVFDMMATTEGQRMVRVWRDLPPKVRRDILSLAENYVEAQ